MTLARALLAADRAAEAAAILDDLPELGGQPAIQRLTAEAKAKSGQYREAEELYEALWEADPADREIAAALIDLYEDEDKLDEALAALDKLAARDSENPAIGERIVLDLARQGRFPESEKKARELVARRPENRAAQRLLATVLFERGSIAEGREDPARTPRVRSGRSGHAPGAGRGARPRTAIRRGARDVRGNDSPGQRRRAQGGGEDRRRRGARFHRVPRKGLRRRAADPYAAGHLGRSGPGPRRPHPSRRRSGRRGLCRRKEDLGGPARGRADGPRVGRRRTRNSGTGPGTRRPPKRLSTRSEPPVSWRR